MSGSSGDHSGAAGCLLTVLGGQNDTDVICPAAQLRIQPAAGDPCRASDVAPSGDGLMELAAAESDFAHRNSSALNGAEAKHSAADRPPRRALGPRPWYHPRSRGVGGKGPT